MTARHCPGCRGYAHGRDGDCAGVPLGGDELIVPDVVPPLPFVSRLRVLIGLPVFMGVSAGPLEEPFELMGFEDEIRHWRDAG